LDWRSYTLAFAGNARQSSIRSRGFNLPGKETDVTAKLKTWWQGLRYRGGGTMIAWLLHRLGGLAMVVFVGMHVFASFLTQQFGSDFGTALNIVYQSPYFQAPLYFLIIFHALNGLRIILLDTFPKLLEYQREVTWLQWMIFIPLYGLAVFFIIAGIISGE
jgi:succinate dehydrogenase / fumarate reductase cytochrome b subunit